MRKSRDRRFISVLAVTFWKGAGMALSLLIAIGIANRFGAGASTDAFFFARRIVTNLAMALERAFHLLQVPPLVAIVQSEGLGVLRRHLWRRNWQILLATLIPSIAIFVFAPWIVSVLAPGFNAVQQDQAELVLRIMVVVLPVSAITALTGAALNALHLFSMPVVARLLPRVAVVLALILLPVGFGIAGLAWAVVGGTVVMGVIFALSIRRALAQPHAVQADPAQSQDFGRARILAMLVAQLHMVGASWIDMGFASIAGVGAVAALEFGQRMVNMAPGVITNSVLVVFYTEFAVALSRGDNGLFLKHIRGAMRASLFMVMPLAVILALLGGPLVKVFLAHGAFSGDAVRQTGIIVATLALLLPVNAFMSTITSAIFADARLPHLRIIAGTTLLAIIIRIALNAVLVPRIGVIGVPIAAVVSMTVLMVALCIILTRQVGAPVTLAQTRHFLSILLAGAAAGLAIWAVYALETPFMAGRFMQLAMLALAGILGGLVYLAVASVLKVPEMVLVHDKIAKLRRKLGR